MKKIIIRLLSVLVILNMMLFSFTKVYAIEIEEKPIEVEKIVVKNLISNQITYNSIDNNITSSISSANLYNKTEGYNPNPLGIQPTNIIGGDERTKVTNASVYPYSTVAYLYAIFPNGYKQGSATMIYKNLAITAGHCIYDKELGGWATEVTILPGRDDGNPHFGSATATNLHMPKNYQDFQFMWDDWAMLELNWNIGSNSGWSGIAYSDGYERFKGKNVTVSGYPEDKEAYAQYVATGPVTDTSDQFLYYDVDTQKGQSGGPVWESGYAIGIHTRHEPIRNRNACVNINKSKFDYFVSYMK